MTKISIFYLNENANHYLHFAAYDFLMKVGLKVEMKNYDKVYELELDAKPSNKLLDDIYAVFNIAKPKDFYNRSMSMGDLIIINDEKIYYVDDYGFTELKEDNNGTYSKI